MNWVFGIGVTAAFIAAEIVLLVAIAMVLTAASVPEDRVEIIIDVINWLILIGCSIWVGWDSSKIHLRHYDGFMSASPVAIGVLCGLLWIIVFPGYLQMRWKITRGQARLKPEYVTVTS